MPYSNFDDTHSIQSVFRENQQQDDDLNIPEFVFEKLLTIGSWFEEEEEEEDAPRQQHQYPSSPLQVQPLQQGSLYCGRIIILTQESAPVIERPYCIFRENKMSFDFTLSVFHPPVFSA